MRDAGLVTVVVPCYKQEAYLSQAIESVLRQTYRPREIVVVDDGSDAVGPVTAAYREVRVVRQDNCGLGAARNAGIREARGQFLVFLDSDDRLLPNALEVGTEHLGLDASFGFVAGLATLIADDGTPIPTVHRQRPVSDHYLNLLRCNITTGIHAAMFPRFVIDEVGGFDTTGQFAGTEDYDLYLRIARQRPIHFHGNIVCEYRQHDASMSRNYATMMRSAVRLLDEHRRMAESPGAAEAARTGIAVFKDYYSDLIVRRMRTSLVTGDWYALSRDIRDIISVHPLALAKLFSKHLYRRVAGVTKDIVEISGTDADVQRPAPL